MNDKLQAPKHKNMRGVNKSKTGCLTCRKRKKKCDGRKPRCYACERLHLQCAYGTRLSWKSRSQLTLNEKNQTINKFWEKERRGCVNRSQPLQIVNFSFAELSMNYQLANGLQLSGDPTKSILSGEEMKLAPLLPPMEHVLDRLDWISRNSPAADVEEEASTEAFLFNHFRDTMGTNRTFGSLRNWPNAYTEFVLPDCFKFRALDQVVLALAALDVTKKKLLYARSAEDRMSIETYYCLHVKYLNASIDSLYRELDEFDSSRVDSLEQLTMTLMLLCSTQITSRGNRDWIKYLVEASTILSMVSEETITSSKRLSYVYYYFFLRYTLLITTLHDEKLRNFNKQISWPIIKSFFTSNKPIPILGCSPKLLYILYRTAMLNCQQFTTKEEEKKLGKEYLKIWNELTEKVEVCGRESVKLQLCAEGYRLAAQIYICISLAEAGLDVYQADNFQAIYEMIVPRLYNVLKLLGKENERCFYPQWTLFMLSTCQTEENKDESRTKILQLYDGLEQSNPLCNVVVIRKAVESIWKAYDLQADDTNNSFDWKSVLEKYGFMLPLT